MAVDERIDQVLRKAIAEKRLVRFKYKGSERVAEPHDYGIQHGRVRLLCWQVGGESNGPLPGWRWIDVESMEGSEVLSRRFAGNREVAGTHHRWDEVFVRVSPPETPKR